MSRTRDTVQRDGARQVGAFALLMALAAQNKWRFAPRLLAGLFAPEHTVVPVH